MVFGIGSGHMGSLVGKMEMSLAYVCNGVPPGDFKVSN